MSGTLDPRGVRERILALVEQERPLRADPNYLRPSSLHNVNEHHREKVVKYINEVHRIKFLECRAPFLSFPFPVAPLAPAFTIPPAPAHLPLCLNPIPLLPSV